MVAENTSKIEAEKAKEALITLNRKDVLSRCPLALVAFVGGLIATIIGIVSKDTNTMMFGSIFLAIGLAYLIFLFIEYLRSPKTAVKANEIICKEGVTYIYKFKEQSIQVNLRTSVKNTKFDYDYKSVKKVVEYPDMYQVKLKENQILFVLKAGFANKEMENFFLRNAVTINKKKLIKRQYKNEKVAE